VQQLTVRDLPHLHDSDMVKSVRLTEESEVTAATVNSLPLLRITITCACKLGYLLSLNWLQTSDCKTHDKPKHSKQACKQGYAGFTPVMLPAWEQGLVRAVLWDRAAF